MMGKPCPFTTEERYEIGSMLALRENARGPLCRPVGDWLVAKAQRTWPRFAGLDFWTKTNVRRCWLLVSYHHPARLCWSWLVRVAFFPRPYGKGLARFWYSLPRQWCLRIPYLIEISWSRQRSDWILSGNAQIRLGAVALYQPRREPEVSMREEAL